MISEEVHNYLSEIGAIGGRATAGICTPRKVAAARVNIRKALKAKRTMKLEALYRCRQIKEALEKNGTLEFTVLRDKSGVPHGSMDYFLSMLEEDGDIRITKQFHIGSRQPLTMISLSR